jgi:hypothetical protein
VQDCHPGREAGAGAGAVDAAWDDDDGVPRHLTHTTPELHELDDAHAGELRVFRVPAGKLFSRRRANAFADKGEVPRIKP